MEQRSRVVGAALARVREQLDAARRASTSDARLEAMLAALADLLEVLVLRDIADAELRERIGALHRATFGDAEQGGGLVELRRDLCRAIKVASVLGLGAQSVLVALVVAYLT